MNFKDRLCAMNCHYRFYELEDFFQSVHKLGMHYVELWSGPMHYYVDARRHDSPEQLKKLCDRYQITIIGICPEQTNPKPNNIAVKQKHRQEEVLNYYRQMIDIACELECRQVLVTSGWCYYSEAVEEAWNRSVVMMKRITDYAKQRNVILALEALQPEESRLVNTIQDIRGWKQLSQGVYRFWGNGTYGTYTPGILRGLRQRYCPYSLCGWESDRSSGLGGW